MTARARHRRGPGRPRLGPRPALGSCAGARRCRLPAPISFDSFDRRGQRSASDRFWSMRTSSWAWVRCDSPMPLASCAASCAAPRCLSPGLRPLRPRSDGGDVLAGGVERVDAAPAPPTARSLSWLSVIASVIARPGQPARAGRSCRCPCTGRRRPSLRADDSRLICACLADSAAWAAARLPWPPPRPGRPVGQVLLGRQVGVEGGEGGLHVTLLRLQDVELRGLLGPLAAHVVALAAEVARRAAGARRTDEESEQRECGCDPPARSPLRSPSPHGCCVLMTEAS